MADENRFSTLYWSSEIGTLDNTERKVSCRADSKCEEEMMEFDTKLAGVSVNLSGFNHKIKI